MNVSTPNMEHRRGTAVLPKAHRSHGDDGSVLVEFALALPILLGILTGIFSIGMAFSNQLVLTQATGTGAQYLQQLGSSTSDPCAAAFSVVKAAAPYLNSAKINLTITINGVTPTQSGNSCSGATLTSLAPITVSSTYPCNISVYGVTFSPSCLLVAKVTEYEY
jgi:Flp pilus assembly protein TadG